MATKRPPPRTRRKKPRTTCALCRGPLPEIAIQHNDDYCSTGCAREGYGTSENRKKLT